MTRISANRRALAALTLLGAGVAAIVGGCAGASAGGSGGTEFMYLATGTNVVQFSIGPTGALTELIPNTAPSQDAFAIATTSDNRFAYAVNRSHGTISQYSIGGDGRLNLMGQATVPAGNEPSAVVAAPNHAFLYVANLGDGTIGEYAIGGDGNLTPLSPPTVAIPSPGAFAVSPNGSFLYASSFGAGQVYGFSIGANGQLTGIGNWAVSQPAGLAIAPNGTGLYVSSGTDGVAEFSIGGDGTLVPLSPATVPTGGLGNDTVAVSPNGSFAYVGVFNGGFPGSPVAQFGVGAGGVLTALNPPSVAAGNAPESVAVDLSGKFVYVANSNDGTLSLFAVNADGTLTAQTTPTINPNGALGMAFSRR